MKKLQLKLLGVFCAVGVAGSAQASSPINWQMGFNLGDRSWDSPGYLNQKIDFHVASLSVSAGFEKYFASVLYEKSLSEEPIELAIDNSQLSKYPSFGFQNSGAGNAGRSEFSMVGGYNFTNSFSGFVGYVNSEVNISNLSQVVVTDVEPQNSQGSINALLVFLYGGVNYSTRGPFVGAGYRWPIGELGALSFSIAYAHLSAQGEINSSAHFEQQNYTLPNGASNWIHSDTSPVPTSSIGSSISGNASGFSYGVSWFGKFPGDSDWLHNLRYVAAAKLYKYDYNGAGIVPSQTNTDSKETYTVFTVGLTETF